MKKEYWIFVAILLIIAAGSYAFGRSASRTSGIITPPAERTGTPTGPQKLSGTYSYADASQHIGEYAVIEGTVVSVYTSKKGTTFFDYCREYDTCPFSAVIFSSDASKFGALSAYEGKTLRITGVISSYQGRAEIIIDDPSRIEIR